MSEHSLGRNAIALLVLVTLCGALSAQAGVKNAKRACSATTSVVFGSCKASTEDDLGIALGNCANVSDKDARASCISDAKDTRRESLKDCKDQRDARAGVCDLLGEAPYEPSFDPADFDSDFAHLTHPNPLFPLEIGDEWTYSNGDEVDVVKITSATKSIEGVTCIVSHDVVTTAGQKTEDTDDWFAAAKNGDVFYCGEETEQLETFPGDNPQKPEVVGIEGSFKSGRDGAQPGILMLATPTVGAAYRQEFALGTAEDLAVVLSTTYSFGESADLDQMVPQALAQLLCSHDCLVTREFSPLEPDAVERKYYAPGIGDFLEIDLGSGEVTRLIDCNFDSRCGMLPTP